MIPPWGVRTVATLLFSTGVALGVWGSPVVNIVAAENFYGSIAEQIGGDEVTVTSIMSDPNVDPREYGSNAENVKAVSEADLVIMNGGGYDGWMDRILSASHGSHRVILRASELAVKRLPGNERVWYSVDDIQAIGIAISKSLQELLPGKVEVFVRNDHAFQESLGPIREKMAIISGRYAGAPVGITETVCLYQAVPLGLRVLTPFEYQKAMDQGKDPPAASVEEMDSQIRQRKIRILICNDQAISSFGARLLAEAKAANIPVVGMTETMPQGETYQTWMLRQLDELRSALIAAGS